MCHFLFFFLRGQRCWVREGQLTQLWDFISGKFQDRSPASSVRVHLSSRRQPLLLQLSGNTQSSFIFSPLVLPVRATQQPRCFSYCYSTEGFFYPLDLSQRLWRYRDVEYIPRRSDDSKTQDGNAGCKPQEDSCLLPSAHSLSLGGQLHAEYGNRVRLWKNTQTHTQCLSLYSNLSCASWETYLRRKASSVRTLKPVLSSYDQNFSGHVSDHAFTLI